MFGIVKTLVGYFAASMSQRFDVQNAGVRLVLGFFFLLLPPVFLLGAGAGRCWARRWIWIYKQRCW